MGRALPRRGCPLVVAVVIVVGGGAVVVIIAVVVSVVVVMLIVVIVAVVVCGCRTHVVGLAAVIAFAVHVVVFVVCVVLSVVPLVFVICLCVCLSNVFVLCVLSSLFMISCCLWLFLNENNGIRVVMFRLRCRGSAIENTKHREVYRRMNRRVFVFVVLRSLVGRLLC